MAKQIYFFFAKDDQEEFFKTVLAKGDKLMNNKSEYTDLNEALANNHHTYIVSPKAEIIIRDNGFIDTRSSQVIEFSRSHLNEMERKIDVGRIYLTTQYYDEKGNLVKKPEWLKQQMDFYVKWIKDYSIKGKNSLGAYIGKSAYVLVQKGYKLTWLGVPQELNLHG